jgi:hypothetical protein
MHALHSTFTDNDDDDDDDDDGVEDAAGTQAFSFHCSER